MLRPDQRAAMGTISCGVDVCKPSGSVCWSSSSVLPTGRTTNVWVPADQVAKNRRRFSLSRGLDTMAGQAEELIPASSWAQRGNSQNQCAWRNAVSPTPAASTARSGPRSSLEGAGLFDGRAVFASPVVGLKGHRRTRCAPIPDAQEVARRGRQNLP